MVHCLYYRFPTLRVHIRIDDPMKKFFTLVFISALCLNATAQTFISTPLNSSVEGSSQEYELVVHAKVYNVNADSLFSWVRIENNLASNWEGSICDKITCYAPTVDSSSFILVPGDSSIMDAHFYLNDSPGNGTIRIMIWAGQDRSTADTIVYHASTWALGTKKLSHDKTISIFPNPTKGILNLEFKSNEKVGIEIYDILGKLKRSFIHEDGFSSFNLTSLPNGLYIIRITENGEVYSRTFRKSN